MKERPMMKREVIAVWVLMVADVEKQKGWGPALRDASMEEKCRAMLRLVHASVRLNCRTFSVARAIRWADKAADAVRKAKP